MSTYSCLSNFKFTSPSVRLNLVKSYYNKLAKIAYIKFGFSKLTKGWYWLLLTEMLWNGLAMLTKICDDLDGHFWGIIPIFYSEWRTVPWHYIINLYVKVRLQSIRIHQLETSFIIVKWTSHCFFNLLSVSILIL